MNAQRSDAIDLAGYVTLVLCLAASMFTIHGANLLPLAGIFWLILAFRERRFEVPAFFWPLVALAAWTLISCAFSIDPLNSFTRSRQLLFFLIVPGAMRLLRGDRAMTTLNVIIGFAAASALVGIVQYAALGYDDMNHRPQGTLGHYMTYSGLLMLVACSSVARLIFYERQWIWPAIAVPSLMVAMLLTNSRNAWVGSAAAISTLVAVRKVKLLLLLPVVGVLFYFAAPPGVQNRMFSIFDLHDATNRDRVAMFKSGINMVKDRPLFGVGLNNVPDEYPKYRSADAVDPAGTVGIATRAHLHNVPLQLAAERGIPAVLFWLWFVIVAGRDLLRQLVRGPSKALAGAGLAAVVGMVVAGMFEHNFGDSEFLTLFLGLITLPFAARASYVGRAFRPGDSGGPEGPPYVLQNQ